MISDGSKIILWSLRLIGTLVCYAWTAGSDAWSCAVIEVCINRWTERRWVINLTRICRFIVIQNRVMKYMTRMGQNTGTLKTSKNVQTSAIVVDFVIAYQNLNSGNRRMNGRNSSLLRVGNAGPSGSSAAIKILLVTQETSTLFIKLTRIQIQSRINFRR